MKHKEGCTWMKNITEFPWIIDDNSGAQMLIDKDEIRYNIGYGDNNHTLALNYCPICGEKFD